MSVLDLVSVSLRIVLVGIAKKIFRSSYARFWIRSAIERTRIQLFRKSRNWIPIILSRPDPDPGKNQDPNTNPDLSFTYGLAHYDYKMFQNYFVHADNVNGRTFQK